MLHLLLHAFVFHQNQRQIDRHTHSCYAHTHTIPCDIILNTQYTHILYILTLKWASTMPLSHKDIHTCEWYYRQKLMSKLLLGGGGNPICMNRVLKIGNQKFQSFSFIGLWTLLHWSEYRHCSWSWICSLTETMLVTLIIINK